MFQLNKKFIFSGLALVILFGAVFSAGFFIGKNRGCTVYDFWGHIDPFKYPKHPYAGPTLFKMGFGGYVQEYVKTQDFIISKKYWINYIVETVRRIKRGL